MSHIVTIETKVTDAVAVAAACQRLSLPAPEQGTATLYSGKVSGLLVRLAEWTYPVVVDLASGAVKFDNYEGAWGNLARFEEFLQLYTVEKAKLEARKKGFAVNEEVLQDGSIRVQIREGD